MAQIVVERTEGSLADRFRPYKVEIDGVVRGRLGSSEAQAFEVPMGIHTVRFRIDFYSSPPIKVAVLATTRLICRSSVAHAFGLIAFLSPSSWIQVREEDSLPVVPAPTMYAPETEFVA